LERGSFCVATGLDATAIVTATAATGIEENSFLSIDLSPERN
jgi:hypothetical protein